MGFFDTLFGSSSKSSQTAAGTIAEQQTSDKNENQTTSGSQSQSSTGSTTGTTQQASTSSQSGQQSTTGTTQQSSTGSSSTQTGGTVNASSVSSLLNALSGTTSTAGTTTTSSLDAGTTAKLGQLIDTLSGSVGAGTSSDVTGLRGIASNELNFATDNSGLDALIKAQTDEATQQYNLTTGAAENVTAQTIGSEGNSYVQLLKGQDAAMLAKEIANIVGQTTLSFRGQQQAAYGTAANALSGAASADIAAKNAPIQQLLAAVDALKGASVTSTQAGSTSEAQKSEQSQTGSTTQQSASNTTTQDAQLVEAIQNALTASSQSGVSNVTGSSSSNTEQDTVATFLQQLQDAINSSSSANQQTTAVQNNKGKTSTPLFNFL